jgi:hypothetical protein
MISYTITVCNEDKELDNLLTFLQNRIQPDDEIVIQMDTMAVTSSVRNLIDSYRNKLQNLTVIEFPLDKDFATFKNNLKKYCTKKWIFNIDADEIPSIILIENIHDILKLNENIDMFLVPRWNTVNGITDVHVSQWRWNLDENNRVNWPDYQTRIYKNTDEIVWKNKVHERLSGFDTYSNLPDHEDFCLYHVKDIKKQEEQNNFYNTI